MRDLFDPPTETPVPDSENFRPASSASSTGSGSVRHITPEDVYDDRERMSYAQYTSVDSEQNTPKAYSHHQQQRPQYIPSADSRQISTTSTTAASGSENWETFDDASEPEADANDAYYAKLKAAKTVGKRFAPEGGYTPPRGGLGKKPRAIYGNTPTTRTREEGGRHVAGSDAGWTDEDAF